MKIFLGNHSEAQRYANEQGISLRSVNVVTNAHQLQGINEHLDVIIGDSWAQYAHVFRTIDSINASAPRKPKK